MSRYLSYQLLGCAAIGLNPGEHFDVTVRHNLTAALTSSLGLNPGEHFDVTVQIYAFARDQNLADLNPGEHFGLKGKF